jgi:hypothetical protein
VAAEVVATQMNKVLLSAIALIVVHAATELWQVIWAIWPQTETARVNLFIDKNALPEGMTVLWWVKSLTDELLWCYVFFDYAYTALRTSRKKFWVVFVFFMYHAFDAAMFVYNYKQSYWIYIVLLVLDAIALVIIFLPMKERAKIVNME